MKTIVVSNIERGIVYKNGIKILSVSEEEIKVNPLAKFTFAKGETFEIPSDKLEALQRAFPNEIQVGNGLTSATKVEKLEQKNAELLKRIAELEAQLGESKPQIKGVANDKDNK